MDEQESRQPATDEPQEPSISEGLIVGEDVTAGEPHADAESED